MRLTHLKLAGFKSFVDPTVVPFRSDMVGVVGPNGCGKSNIIDAVRWVLGEKRASELRGESMQDVIFNGSGNRKPAGRASVELVFDNSAGRSAGQWSAYAEIVIRRVLSRDGNSSYFVNNQLVRLKDIRDIFLGTGLGAQGYAIIGQGTINRLIEARPEDLRVMLEEAASVSRYKERRKETESRLKDTRENLLRLDDEVRNIQERLESLEVQAEVANRYHELQHEGQIKQHALWFLRELSARQEQQQKATLIEQAHNELEKQIASLRKAESEVEISRQQHYKVNEALHAAQGSLYQANAVVTRLELERKNIVDMRQRLEQRQEQLKQQASQWQEQYDHAKEQLEQLSLVQEELIAKQEELVEQKESLHEQLPSLEEELEQQRLQHDEVRHGIAQIEQKIALNRQQQQTLRQQLLNLEERQRKAQTSLSQIVRPDQASLEQLIGDHVHTQGLWQEAQNQLEHLEQRLPELDQGRNLAQQEFQQQNQILTEQKARLGVLEQLQANVVECDLAKWLSQHAISADEPIWQKLKIKNGFEKALEAALQQRLAALELPDTVGANFGDNPPPVLISFYSTKNASNTVNANANAVSERWSSLSSLVQCDAPLLQVVRNWLHQVYVVESLAQALADQDKLQDGQFLVCPQGHCVDKYGVHYYANSTASDNIAGRLSRQQEIEHLYREIKAQQLITEHALNQVNQAQSAWHGLSQSILPARQRGAELLARVHDLQLTRNRLEQQGNESDLLSQRFQSELEELQALQQECQEQMAILDEELYVLEEELNQAQSSLSLHSNGAVGAKVQSLQQRLQELERQIQELQFSQRSNIARQEELQRNLKLAQQQIQQAQNELDDQGKEWLQYDEDESAASLQEALENKVIQEESLQQVRLQLEEIAAQLGSLDEQRMRCEQSLQPLRDSMTKLQLDEQAARLAVEQFSAELDSNQVNRHELQEYLDEQNDQWKKITWLQSEVQRISRQIDSLGAVNMAALDELKVTQERKGYLDSQHQDLEEAMQTLEQAIRQIDRETRGLLSNTFNEVNQHFGTLFPQLFGGGQAKLIMTGEEILDAGVQVMAQPPGKKNSTIHLLSGGEKALTAIALVFAFFKLNPAPFCLLDEVDAPLDDANTERYANLVQSMSSQTQFLFISHNKITMQLAKQLIGVTMQEQGVSRVVAVDMDEAISNLESV